MQSENKIFDDIARLFTSAAGAAQGVRAEVQTLIRQQVERLVAELDLVPREDFEAVREMAVAAREENERLEARVSALEKALSAEKGPAAAKSKSRAKKKTAKRTTKKTPPPVTD